MTEFEQKTLEHLAQMNETLSKLLKIMQGFADQQEHQRREIQRAADMNARIQQDLKGRF